jgi:nicotinamide-nucleotide amidase
MAPDDRELEALARNVGDWLMSRGLTLATAESCTGGWIGKAITDVAGSSAWFLGGIVTYADDAKVALLAVPAALLARDGAVSESVVRAMAEGAITATGAHRSVAVSGVAGPDGGTPDKPVGTVCFAWAAAGSRTRSEARRFPGDRESVRRLSVRHALAGVRET